MQVNSANLAGLGLSITDTFDTCRNIQGGSRILASGYVAPGSGGDTQPALIQALSPLQYRQPGARYRQRLRRQSPGRGGADCSGNPPARGSGANF